MTTLNLWQLRQILALYERSRINEVARGKLLSLLPHLYWLGRAPSRPLQIIQFQHVGLRSLNFCFFVGCSFVAVASFRVPLELPPTRR